MANCWRVDLTDEMVEAYEDAAWETPAEIAGQEFANIREGLRAVLAIVERDHRGACSHHGGVKDGA